MNNPHAMAKWAAGLAAGLLFAGCDDEYAVPKEWEICPILGRKLYAQYHPSEGWAKYPGGPWNHSWTNAPALPMFKNVICELGRANMSVSDYTHASPGYTRYARLRKPEEKWQGAWPVKFQDVMATQSPYLKEHLANFLKHRPGQPYTLILGGDGRAPFVLSEKFDVDAESFRAWEAEHPGFIGFQQFDEFDQDTWEYYWWLTAKKHETDPAVEAAITNAYPLTERNPSLLTDWVETAARRVRTRAFGCERVNGLYSACLSAGFDLARVGVNPIVWEAELGSTSSPWRWGGMFVRGAGRQFGVPWGWYMATLIEGVPAKDGTKPERTETSFVEWPSPAYPQGVPYKGCARSLLARNVMYGYFAGATFLQQEKCWEFLCAHGPDGKAVPSPYAMDFNAPFAFDEAHDRGVPYTPVALLVSIREPVRRDNYTGNKDRFTMPAFLMTLVPTHEKDPGRYRDTSKGDAGCLWNSEFGEICDVLCPDIPAGCANNRFRRVLGAYRRAFLVGHFDRERLDRDALVEYVRRGGVLHVERRHVEAGLVPPEIPGARGRVVVVEHFLPDYFRTSKEDWFPTKLGKLSSGEITCPVIHDLLKKAQDETMPVAVEGDIQWGLNKTAKGWLVWMMNNKGVKKFYLSPEELDPKATSHVKVTFKPTGKVYEADVGAGQWTTIEIE